MWNLKARITFKNPKARITFKISHKMCSTNSPASAKKVRRNSRKPIKNPAEFSYRLAWHKRTNCLSLKPHRKILLDLHAEFCLTNYHWKVNVGKFNTKLKKLNWKFVWWRVISTLKLLYRPKCSWKAKPEHFQTN